MQFHGQYWEIQIYDLRCNANIFLHWSIDLKELIKFIIAYVVLHYPPYSVLYISYFWKQLLKMIPWNRRSPKLSVKLNSSQIIFIDF